MCNVVNNLVMYVVIVIIFGEVSWLTITQIVRKDELWVWKKFKLKDDGVNLQKSLLL